MADKLAQSVNQQQHLVPNYKFTLGWEDSFDFDSSVETFNNNPHVPFVIALLIYLPILYVGQMIMSKRDPFNVKLVMIVWNSGLAIFSILGFCRMFPEMLYVYEKFGFNHTFCNNSFIHSKEARFWIYLFVLSKIPELGDTVFLVLRKQKLIFLHVYHHATVLVFSWFVYATLVGAARWFCCMNFGIHAIMYSYYALKALPNLIRIPKWVSMMITALQTLQMVVGAAVVGLSSYMKFTGRKCDTSTGMSVAGLAIYTSYLVLFSRFFYSAYCSPQPTKHAQAGGGAAIKKRA